MRDADRVSCGASHEVTRSGRWSLRPIRSGSTRHPLLDQLLDFCRPQPREIALDDRPVDPQDLPEWGGGIVVLADLSHLIWVGLFGVIKSFCHAAILSNWAAIRIIRVRDQAAFYRVPVDVGKFVKDRCCTFRLTDNTSERIAQASIRRSRRRLRLEPQIILDREGIKFLAPPNQLETGWKTQRRR